MKMIEKLITNSTSKNILFLGKLINLTPKEIESFLEKEGLNFCQSYEEDKDYAFVVLSSLINPYEEEISYEVYNRGIKDIKLEQFEAYYISKIKPNSLLMSIKLKNDKDRILRLLNLNCIDDSLYLKLLNLYKWEEGSVFDSNSNRDVTISFIKRFLPTRANVNHNEIVHSPASLLEIALICQNRDVLKSMLKFPKYELRSRGKEDWKPKELKEFIATNESIDNEIIEVLLNLNNSRIDTLLALNCALNQKHLETIYNRTSHQGKINLTKNSNLTDELFKKLLDSEVKKELLNNQIITKNRLALIKEDDLIYLSNNSNISEIIDEILFKNRDLDFALGQNIALNSNKLQMLYKKYGNNIAINLSKNPNTPKELLKEFFKLDSWDIKLNLATNPSTPIEILDTLCQMNNRELNLHLATNESVRDEYLEFFKVDNELLRALSKNKKFLKNMEKKAII